MKGGLLLVAWGGEAELETAVHNRLRPAARYNRPVVPPRNSFQPNAAILNPHKWGKGEELVPSHMALEVLDTPALDDVRHCQDWPQQSGVNVPEVRLPRTPWKQMCGGVNHG